MNDSLISGDGDEAFAVGFEVRTLADHVLRGGVERWVPHFCAPQTDLEHRTRYEWVRQFVAGRRVLDLASGCGRGALLIAEAGAREVVGCDIDSEAARYASIRHRHSQLTFIVGNAETLRLPEKFDVVVSFETIEHVPDVDAYLATIRDALVPGGRFFVSTPISAVALNNQPSNRYHVREWGFDRFQRLIGTHFQINAVYVQVSARPAHSGFVQRVARRLTREFTGARPSDVTPMDVRPWTSSTAPPGGFQIVECTRA